MAPKLTRLTHEIAIQRRLVAESYIICSSLSRRPVRKLLDTPSYVFMFWVEILFVHSLHELLELCNTMRDLKFSRRWRYEVVVFQAVTPCTYMVVYHSFGGPSCLHLQGDLNRYHATKMSQKVSGLAAWSENCKWYNSLPLGAVVSLFCESV
jgi:hypothetical protein